MPSEILFSMRKVRLLKTGRPVLGHVLKIDGIGPIEARPRFGVGIGQGDIVRDLPALPGVQGGRDVEPPGQLIEAAELGQPAGVHLDGHLAAGAAPPVAERLAVDRPLVRRVDEGVAPMDALVLQGQRGVQEPAVGQPLGHREVEAEVGPVARALVDHPVGRVARERRDGQIPGPAAGVPEIDRLVVDGDRLRDRPRDREPRRRVVDDEVRRRGEDVGRVEGLFPIEVVVAPEDGRGRGGEVGPQLLFEAEHDLARPRRRLDVLGVGVDIAAEERGQVVVVDGAAIGPVEALVIPGEEGVALEAAHERGRRRRREAPGRAEERVELVRRVGVERGVLPEHFREIDRPSRRPRRSTRRPGSR